MDWDIPSAWTLSGGIKISLSFERYNGENLLVWQTATMQVIFASEICVGGIIEQGYPDALTRIDAELSDHELRITTVEGYQETALAEALRNHNADAAAHPPIQARYDGDIITINQILEGL